MGKMNRLLLLLTEVEKDCIRMWDGDLPEDKMESEAWEAHVKFVIGEHYANEPHLSWDMYKDSGAAIEEQLKYEAEIEGGG